MLVLSRKKGEAVLIGDDIELTVLEIIGDTVRIGIKAPSEIGILRKELYVSVEHMNQDAEKSSISTAELINQFKQIKKS